MTAVAGLLVFLVLVADPRTHAFASTARGRAAAASAAAAANAEEAPQPAADDRDRERILRLQSSLRDIVHMAFGRLKVGLRVIEAHTGRVMFGRGTTTLMDPASNQKVLATTTALVRLGGDWRFRTEVYGEPPDADGVVRGDLFLRGSGDPTLSVRELEELASRLVARGVTRVTGGIVADPRRVGDDRPPSGNDQSAQLAIQRGIVGVHVRPGEVGEPPSVSLEPPPPATLPGAAADFVVINKARTAAGNQRKLSVDASAAKGVLRIDVSGRIGSDNAGVVYRRRAGDGALIAAIFFRAALTSAGVSVRERASIGSSDLGAALLTAHSSAPLSLLLRKINKDSDNYEAERLLEAVGAEVLGGPPSTEKGIEVLRDVIGEFGLDPRSYVPRNGSGLGHANRISARAMTELLRAIYLDPRVGPELMQSLSVGGIDGTTRNRFRGTPVARHVRAKTGTLVGKSVLSGLVGDGGDVMAFSIMVQGFKTRSALSAVRGAQVAAVNTMMRYVQERGGARVDTAPPPLELGPNATDYETGGEMETEDETPEPTPVLAEKKPAPLEKKPAPILAEKKPAPIVAEKKPALIVAEKKPAPIVAEKKPASDNHAGSPAVARPAAPRRLARATDVSVSAPARAADPLEKKAAAAPDDADAEGRPDGDTDADGAGGTGASPFSTAHLGVGGAGSISGGDAAPGARLFMDFGGAGLGIETEVYGTNFHAISGPGTGTTEWTRMVAAVGPRYRVSNKSLSLDVKAAVAAGWFWVEGHGYTMNSSSRTWAVGGGLGARLAWERGAMSPWLGLDAMGWPGRHAIQVMGVEDTRAIPSLDLLLSLGASFRLW